MKPVTLENIRSAVNGRLIGRRRGVATGVSTDTRKLAPGDAFFALVARRDGHEFTAGAFSTGASAAVVSKPVHVPPGKTAILVNDTLKALGDLAEWYRRRMRATVVAITGSNGKTTTKEMVARLLAAAAPTIKSPESFNNAIGVPHTIFRIEPDDRFAVVEMGASAPGEIRRLAEIARPRIGVITNVAPAHLAGLGTIKGVAAEKGCLIEGLPASGTAVVNADNHWCLEIAGRAAARAITFGIQQDALVRATAVECSATSTRFRALGRTFSLPVIGRHNVYNALAAIAVGMELGLDADSIRDQLAAYRLPPMRMERLEVGGVTLFNDAYNANFESMLAALRAYARLPAPGRKVIVLGDMLELGEQSQQIHREVGRRIAAADVDLLLAIGQEARHVAEGAADHGMPQERILHCLDTAAAGRALPGMLERRDTILLKASRAMKLESVIDAIARSGTPILSDASEEAYHTFRAPALR